MTTVSLEGLQSGAEERAIAILKVDHNGQSYDWQVFVPVGADLSTFISGCATSVGAEIDYKEAQWAAMNPKPENKSDVVRPEIPDYYAKRRAEYPAIGDQLDAQWKGGDAAAAMQAKIQAVKNKYPKPTWAQ